MFIVVFAQTIIFHPDLRTLGWPSVLPGGRFTSQKAQKGPVKKMAGRKNFIAEFGQNWPKRGQIFFIVKV